jgi:hypothetical protein
MKPAQAQPHDLRPTAGNRHATRASLFERLAAGMLSAVIVCRFLTPTDAAMLGETLWIAQFAILAFLVWAFAAWRSDEFVFRFDWLDASVLLLCLGHVVGALVLISTRGDKRAAMTMLWEWIGLWVTFFLMRRLLVQPASRQNLLLAVVSTAAVLAGLGVWQHQFGFSESRHKYEELKSRMETLKQTGRPRDPGAALDWDRSVSGVRSDFVQLNIPTDDAARMLWEQRLYSAEPIALFALANTLAGILVVSAIVWLGLLFENGNRVNRLVVVMGTIVTLLVFYCLLLTKSRTAWVGLTVGLAAWGIKSRMMRTRPLPWLKRGLAAGVVAMAVLIAVAYASGGLDRFVVSESAKSLRYRLEYWTATWHMLAKTTRNLVLGVGPGNFRQNYLEFKLPQSSEEIADPHDLILDVWANGGLIGLLGLAGVCCLGVRPLWRRAGENPSDPVDERRVSADATKRSTSAEIRIPTEFWSDGIVLGGAMGFLLILFLGLADEATLALLWPAWLLIVLLCRPIFQGAVPRVVAAAAGVALIVHLAGAGGIGMPAVSQVLLLLAMLAAPGAEVANRRSASAGTPGREGPGFGLSTAGWEFRAKSPVPVVAIGLVGLSLYLACWFTGLMPIVTVRSLAASAKEALYDRGQPSQAERDFRLAAEFDPWSATACERLSEMAFQSWLATDGDRPDVFERCRNWQMRAIERDPRNPGGYRVLGEIYLSQATREQDSAAALAAVEAFQMAVALYPNHAVTQSQLAEALSKAGKIAAAREAARRARQLDQINEQAGHADKRLSDARRRLVDTILGQDSN